MVSKTHQAEPPSSIDDVDVEHPTACSLILQPSHFLAAVCCPRINKSVRQVRALEMFPFRRASRPRCCRTLGALGEDCLCPHVLFHGWMCAGDDD